MIRRRRTLSCREVGRALQEFLDEEITDTQRAAQLREHLEACRDCGLEADTYRRLLAALHQQAPTIDSPELQRLRDFGSRLAAGEVNAD